MEEWHSRGMKALRYGCHRLPHSSYIRAAGFPLRTRLYTTLRRTINMSATAEGVTSTATTTLHNTKRQQTSRQPATSASTTSSTTQTPTAAYDYSSLRLTDIGANLIDDMFSGLYHATAKHRPDLHAVLTRAAQHGLSTIIVTAGTYDECKAACELIRQHQQSTPQLQLRTTCGIHPTRTKAFAALSPQQLQQHFDDMGDFIAVHRDAVVAVGECGFDVDRLHFSSLDEQLTVFPYHIRLAQHTGLPLFLHDRGATSELLPLLAVASPPVSGVVHSYTGSVEAMLEYVSHGFYIGVNGCSLKTDANLATVAAVPSERLLLETDAPWCEIKATHAGFQHVRSRWSEVKAEKADVLAVAAAGGGGGVLVKGRNEPCKLLCVAEVVAAVRGVSVEELAATVADNTERLFGMSKLRQNSLRSETEAKDAVR